MKILKYAGAAALLAAMLCVFGVGCHNRSDYSNYYEAKTAGIEISLAAPFGETEAAGNWEWKAYEEGGQNAEKPIYFLFKFHGVIRNQSYISATVIGYLNWPPAEAGQVEKGGFPIHFSLVRPAGRWDFQGTKQFRGASGACQFLPDASFVNDAGAICGERPSMGDLIQLGISCASIDGLRKYKAAAPNLDVNGWVKFVHSGVTPEFAESMKAALGEISVHDLIKYRNNGMTPEYAASMKNILGGISVDALIESRNSGLMPEYAVDFSKAGYPFNHKELIKLRNSGMTVDFAAGLKKGGLNLTVDQLIQLRNSGVPPSYAVQITELGFGGNLHDIVKMRNSGVEKDFAAAVKESDNQVSIDEIIKLRNSGVSAGYVRSVKKLGYVFSIEQR